MFDQVGCPGYINGIKWDMNGYDMYIIAHIYIYIYIIICIYNVYTVYIYIYMIYPLVIRNSPLKFAGVSSSGNPPLQAEEAAETQATPAQPALETACSQRDNGRNGGPWCGWEIHGNPWTSRW